MSYFLKTILLFYTMLFTINGQEFGQNIVQYRKFDWHYIQTENFDIYYYPLEDTKENIVMVIYINKEVKQNILDSCLEHNCNLLHLTLDIFSANDSSKIFGSNSLNSYIIWKIMKNNYHYITYYKKGSLNHLIKVKKSFSILSTGTSISLKFQPK